MHGIMNKKSLKAAFSFAKRYGSLIFLCVPDADTYIVILWTNTSLLFLSFLPPFLILGLRLFNLPTISCYYSIPPLDLAGIFLSLCLNLLSEIQLGEFMLASVLSFLAYLSPSVSGSRLFLWAMARALWLLIWIDLPWELI